MSVEIQLEMRTLMTGKVEDAFLHVCITASDATEQFTNPTRRR